jgi:NAD(P)-dependent dehydrogenase (short-subunit alcohol dehydrogenase family)
VCDVSNYDEVKSVFKEIKKIDILINNAGTNRPDHFMKIKKEDMDYVVDLNIKAAFHVAQMGAKIMIKSKNRKSIGGSIINMSSQLGKVGAPIRSIYNMTKFGIEGLTRGMALDLAKNNIRVNSICPTFVETPLVKNFFKDNKFKKAVMDNIPLGRLATESDIATAVVYLASNASSMMTGSSLVIDGGWTAK